MTHRGVAAGGPLRSTQCRDQVRRTISPTHLAAVDSVLPSRWFSPFGVLDALPSRQQRGRRHR